MFNPRGRVFVPVCTNVNVFPVVLSDNVKFGPTETLAPVLFTVSTDPLSVVLIYVGEYASITDFKALATSISVIAALRSTRVSTPSTEGGVEVPVRSNQNCTFTEVAWVLSCRVI